MIHQKPRSLALALFLIAFSRSLFAMEEGGVKMIMCGESMNILLGSTLKEATKAFIPYIRTQTYGIINYLDLRDGRLKDLDGISQLKVYYYGKLVDIKSVPRLQIWAKGNSFAELPDELEELSNLHVIETDFGNFGITKVLIEDSKQS